MEFAKNFAALVGRICLSVIFLTAGVDKIMHFSSTLAVMASKGLPYEALLILAAILELVAGLMVLLGFKARIGAALIILFVLILTPIFHDFWNYQAMEAVNQTHHFFKNLAIVGGFLYILAFGAGSLSFDGIQKKKRVHKR